MNKIYFLLILIVLFTSCVITKTPGFYSGYWTLSATEKDSIIFVTPQSYIRDLKNDRKIYAINGIQLRDFLGTIDTSVVYFWSPNCSSDNCISLKACQDFCDSKNYHLLVVSNYYDFDKMQIQNEALFPHPMFSVDEKYYNTKYCNKYNKLFISDLLVGQKIKEDDLYNRFMIFKKGILLKSVSNILSR